MSKKPRISLDLLKSLVAELDKSLADAEAIAEAAGSKGDPTKYIIELSRAAGLTGVLVQEATLLIKDVYAMVHIAQGAGPVEADPVAQLMDMLGGAPPKRSAN